MPITRLFYHLLHKQSKHSKILHIMFFTFYLHVLFNKPIPAELIESMVYTLNSTNYECKKTTKQLLRKSFV